MRILIYTPETEIGEWAKETLNEFGRGMHIHVSDKPEMLEGKWSFVITIGEDCNKATDPQKDVCYPIPQEDEERTGLRRRLWALYRDTLRDQIGSKCSCGLYDVCHCH